MANPTSSEVPTVLVAGDVVTDHCIYQGGEWRSGSINPQGTLAIPTPGGAALFYRLLKAVAPALRVAPGYTDAGSASVANGYFLFRPFPKAPKKEHVWRLSEPLGFETAQRDLGRESIDPVALSAGHSVVVLDDAGLWFRRWPSRFAWPQFLLDGGAQLPDWLVIKMSAPVASGDLWHTLVSGETQHNKPTPVRKGAKLRELLDRTVAVISIHDLRVEPLLVSRNLSWERAALDLAQELCRNPRLEGLRRVRFVVVTLDSDGALLAEFPPDAEPRFRLIFDPGGLEGSFAAAVEGGLFGFQGAFTAAFVAQLAANTPSRGDERGPLVAAIRGGLCTMRRLHVEGHGPAAPRSPAPALPEAALREAAAADDKNRIFGAADIPVGKLRSDAWNIIAPQVVRSPVPLFGLARRVALYGVEQLRDTPYLQFGKLYSIERTELESLRTLERLLKNYHGDPKADKPLSIAVFGPPGAGKSFGVKQLSATILGDEVQLLEFNLSQFRDAAELLALFHQVRDCALRGKFPVVFWDEFDSRSLFWLQYLLAPMQDGAFQEGQVTHPIGKCVFVFAGGTCEQFAAFGEPPQEITETVEPGKVEQWRREFKARKGPDFQSRLGGYLDVIGPNPRGPDDVTYPVRRALLLRVHLKALDPSESLRIDRGLLTAFLAIDKYRHGSRSIEKIAEQVYLRSRTRREFTRSDLPPRSQLDLHVNADAFLELLERE